MSKSSRRFKKQPKPVNIPEFTEWMDGYCGGFDDFSDGAWQAACEEGVDAYNEEHGTNIDPNDGFHMWLQARNE